MTKTVFKLAAFVAVCTVFTLYLAFTIGNVHPFQHTYGLSAVFDDVTGLLPNDNVKVAGVPVGKVTGIKIVDGKAKVTFRVRDDVKLPKDTKAAVRWRNLLGQRYVYLYPGTASTTMAKGTTITRTVSVVDLGELFNRLGPIINAIDPGKVNTFLDNIVAALDGNEDNLRQSITDLATLTKGLASRDDAIGRLIENANAVTGAIDSRDAQIRQVLDNLLAVASTFNENTDVLDRAVTQLGTFTNELGPLLAANRGAIDGSLASLQQLTDLVRAKLPTVDAALANLDDAAQRLFTSSKYGEWLNQTIPCGKVGYNPAVPVDACILHAPGAGQQAAAGNGAANGGGRAGRAGERGTITPPPGSTTGAEALLQLLGGAR